MRSLLLGAVGAVTFSMISLGACGGSSDDTTTPAYAGADVRYHVDGGLADNYVPYHPLAQRCVAGPYPEGGITPFDAGTPDTDAGDTDAAPPLGPPQLVSYGGRTMHTPHIVPITYAGDELADQIEDFVGSFGCTDYWRTVVSEYGVGEADMITPVRLTDPAPNTISDNQISAFIGKQIKAGTPGFVNPPEDVLFAFYFPAETTIELFGSESCSSFDGYHSSMVYNGKHISYAVMARCTEGAIDEVTGTSSHEFVEATTDPDPETAPAYLQPDADHIVFSFLAGGESGDLCTFMPNSMFLPDGYPFVVQRTWSNASIAGGHDPCVPVQTGPYVVGIPDQPDVIPVQNAIASDTTRGVALAVGDTRTIDIHLFAEGGSSMAWNIEALDASEFLEGQSRLTLVLDTASASNGGVAHLTITRNSKGQVYGAEPFSIHSQYAGRDSYYAGVVGDPM